MKFLNKKGGYLLKLFKGLEEMFEGDSADKCVGKFPFVSMGAEWRV
jgi:hypothetical protein